MDNNLKDYREKELKNYVIGNALIIIVLLGIFNTLLDVKMDESTNNILLTLSSEIISAGIFSSILYTYLFLMLLFLEIGKIRSVIYVDHFPVK